MFWSPPASRTCCARKRGDGLMWTGMSWVSSALEVWCVASWERGGGGGGFWALPPAGPKQTPVTPTACAARAAGRREQHARRIQCAQCCALCPSIARICPIAGSDDPPCFLGSMAGDRGRAEKRETLTRSAALALHSLITACVAAPPGSWAAALAPVGRVRGIQHVKKAKTDGEKGQWAAWISSWPGKRTKRTRAKQGSRSKQLSSLPLCPRHRSIQPVSSIPVVGSCPGTRPPI